MKISFGLYLILTDPIAGYEACADAAIKAQVSILQLRMKTASRQELLDIAENLRRMTRDTLTRLIINDNLAIAMEADADGVHLGQGDISIKEARTIWNQPDKILGLSTHNMEQAAEAEHLGADYIGIGPVFPTNTKLDTEPVLGIDETARIARNVNLPSVAIGGINAGNLPDLLRAGMRNFCVVGAVNQSPDPFAAIRNLQAIWESHSF